MIIKRLRKLANGGYALPPVVEAVGVALFFFLICIDWASVLSGQSA